MCTKIKDSMNVSVLCHLRNGTPCIRLQMSNLKKNIGSKLFCLKVKHHFDTEKNILFKQRRTSYN